MQVATLEAVRGQGIGKAVMHALTRHARQYHADLLPKMGAQTHALPFYANMGWRQYGEEFDDAGIPHYAMMLPPETAEARQALLSRWGASAFPDEVQRMLRGS